MNLILNSSPPLAATSVPLVVNKKINTFAKMSRNYKFLNPEGLYFVSFATVFWLDVFVREDYSDCIVKNLNYCVSKKSFVTLCLI
jgi:hypothetical protein